jgi:hypothetical protein
MFERGIALGTDQCSKDYFVKLLLDRDSMYVAKTIH